MNLSETIARFMEPEPIGFSQRRDGLEVSRGGFWFIDPQNFYKPAPMQVADPEICLRLLKELRSRFSVSMDATRLQLNLPVSDAFVGMYLGELDTAVAEAFVEQVVKPTQSPYC